MGITSACAVTPNCGSNTWPSVMNGTRWLDLAGSGLSRRSRPTHRTRASLSPPGGGGVGRHSQQRTRRSGGHRPTHDSQLRAAKPCRAVASEQRPRPRLIRTLRSTSSRLRRTTVISPGNDQSRTDASHQPSTTLRPRSLAHGVADGERLGARCCRWCLSFCADRSTGRGDPTVGGPHAHPPARRRDAVGDAVRRRSRTRGTGKPDPPQRVRIHVAAVAAGGGFLS